MEHNHLHRIKFPCGNVLKKLIVPTKRSKNRQSTTPSKIPTLLLNELSENEPSKFTITDQRVFSNTRDFFCIDQTVPDGIGNNRLHNPIKLSDLKSWITLNLFPEEQLRLEYDVNFDMTF